MGSKSNSTSTLKNIYADTTTSNPYAYSRTNNTGTVSGFQDNTALNSVYNFVNKNINSLLDEYLTPNLNSVRNQAKLNTFTKNLEQQTKNNLENNIINPLSSRNMIRSSQASDLYKNLAGQNATSTADYINNLLSDSQSNTAQMLSNLLSYYMLGANLLNNMQSHSLNSSSGNSTRINSSSSGSGNAFTDNILPIALSIITNSTV